MNPNDIRYHVKKKKNKKCKDTLMIKGQNGHSDWKWFCNFYR